jgi:hypothetical protein
MGSWAGEVVLTDGFLRASFSYWFIRNLFLWFLRWLRIVSISATRFPITWWGLPHHGNGRDSCMSTILTVDRRGTTPPPQGSQVTLARALIAHCGRCVKFNSKGWALSIWCTFKLLASEGTCRCRRLVSIWSDSSLRKRRLAPLLGISWSDPRQCFYGHCRLEFHILELWPWEMPEDWRVMEYCVYLSTREACSRNSGKSDISPVRG